MHKHRPYKRLKDGERTEYSPQILYWRRYRKRKAQCMRKPAKPRALKPFELPIKNIFAPDEE